jgi:hypothetical protein
VKGAGILPATVLALIALFMVAALIWIGFTRLLRDAWPWQVGGLETTTPTPGFQTTQLVLTLVGGVGAAILVVVAYAGSGTWSLPGSTNGAVYTGGTVTFNGAQFTGGKFTFNEAQFTGSHVDFERAGFAGGNVTRDGAEFRGWPRPDPDTEPIEPVAG